MHRAWTVLRAFTLLEYGFVFTNATCTSSNNCANVKSCSQHRVSFTLNCNNQRLQLF